MVACFRPSLSWTCVIELALMNHDKTLAVKHGCRNPAVKPAFSSKYMVGKADLYFQNHFINWSKLIRVFSFKNTSGSFDETMLFTVVVSALIRSSLIFLVVELTKQ